jgi:hypothetical protein
MTSSSLDASLSSVWEEAAGNPKKDLTSDDTTMRTYAAAIVDHETQSYHKKAGAEQDEWFQTPHAVHSHANNDTRQRGAKAVQ